MSNTSLGFRTMTVTRPEPIFSVPTRDTSADLVIASAASIAAVRPLVTGVVQRHIIPRPTGDTGKMLKISAFDKN